MYRIVREKHRDYKRYVDMTAEMDQGFTPSEGSCLYLVEKDDRVVAYAQVEEGGDLYILHRIYVEEESRYHSVGTKLMNYILSSALRKGADELTIKYNEEEGNLFFEKNLFQKIEEGYSYKGIQKRKERTREGIKGTWISIIINIVLSALKITVGFVGGSRALIADGFHSISDVVSSFVILFSVHFGSAPEDEDHPYGHEKIESIAGNMVGVILILTAFELTRDSLVALLKGNTFTVPAMMTLGAAGISIVVKYWLYIYKIRIGERTKNDALMADAREHRSDAISSVGVLVGLILSIWIHPVFDTLLGILVSLFIGKEGISIIMDTSNTLLDKQDREFIEKIEAFVREEHDISNIHDILMRVSGDKVFLSFHIRMPKEMTVYDAHEVADALKYALLDEFQELRDVTIHLDYIID